uniref:Glucose dehydrogenase [FAD, quinone] n=1 Tax=Cacopsylla melanoneura TaxID=428564 RepID=A0A8D9B5V5_9HEMI
MGGTTVLNGLMYCRGDASDYDHYETLGALGWGYKDVLPYFLKSEHNVQYEASEKHGKGGLLTVSYYNDLPNLGRIILAAGSELGYPTDVDIGHGKLREGFYRAQMTTRNGARRSSAKAFVRPFLDRRPNLKILMNAQVTRVLLNKQNAAIGVEYVKNNRTHILRARREVILSAGTIHSPVILMHSGIGPAEHLKNKGIPVRVPLDGVGKNLKNHVSYQIKVDLLGSDGRNQLHNQSLATYVRYGRGPMSSTGLSQIGAMIAPNQEKVPNLQVR